MEFRLLTENLEYAELERAIQVNDRRWFLSKHLHVNLRHPEIPKFTCISYVWGRAREPNPLYPGEVMSSNTIPALSSAMAHSTSSTFWIDALCVPPTLPAKHHTLGSMGYIYSAAESVIIVLPPALITVLTEMKNSDRLSEEVLLSLEEDNWVRSVWTYQEVVNAAAVFFVSGNVKIDGSHFLNCLGHSLQLYEKSQQLTPFHLPKQLPKLNALEELLLDWMLGGYTERSAMQAMSQFQYRYNHDPRNYFFAVVGTMVGGPWPWNVEMNIEELAEEFMDTCEKKNDYSFIYSANPRNITDQKGRNWRPIAGLLQVVLAWHSWGKGQRGRHDEHGFWLEKMVSLQPSIGLVDRGKSFVRKWVESVHPSIVIHTDDDIAQQVLEDLRQMGFSGSKQFLWTAHGIYFPQTAIADGAETQILIAAEVRWPFGGPGLAMVSQEESTKFVPGVFVGEVVEDLAIDILMTPRKAQDIHP